jgi:hypothetical protein
MALASSLAHEVACVDKIGRLQAGVGKQRARINACTAVQFVTPDADPLDARGGVVVDILDKRSVVRCNLAD